MILFDRVYEKHNFLLKKKNLMEEQPQQNRSAGGGKDSSTEGLGTNGSGMGSIEYVCTYIHTFYLSTAPDFLIMSHITPQKKNLWKLRVLKEIP